MTDICKCGLAAPNHRVGCEEAKAPKKKKTTKSSKKK